MKEGQICNPLGNSVGGYSWVSPSKSLMNYSIKTKHKEENVRGSCLPS